MYSSQRPPQARVFIARVVRARKKGACANALKKKGMLFATIREAYRQKGASQAGAKDVNELYTNARYAEYKIRCPRLSDTV